MLLGFLSVVCGVERCAREDEWCGELRLDAGKDRSSLSSTVIDSIAILARSFFFCRVLVPSLAFGVGSFKIV